MDPIGFMILATATGISGGGIRDALLATPAFWRTDTVDLLCCIIVALLAFPARATFHLSERGDVRFRILPWVD